MKRIPLHLDIESKSEVDLKASGVYVYAEHESTEILVLCYAFGEGPVQTWRPGDELPQELVKHINEGGEIRAHNAQFERIVLNGVAGKRIKFPYISIEQTTCTAAKMAAHGLPRALGDAASALGTIPKNDAGRTTMLQLSKPRRGAVKWYTRENAPEKFAILDSYCANDVEVERAIDHIVPDLPKSEQEVYWLDQKINDRGIAVDLQAIDNLQYIVDRYKDELHKKCTELTGYAPTQRDKIAEWVRSNGYPGLTDMQAETVKRAVLDPKVPDNCKTALKIFSTYGNKAVSKLEAMRSAVSSNGRLQGMFLYHGAGTGRWSSLKVQLQNLFRGVIPDPETAIDALAARDLNWIRALYPGVDPMKVVASCIRGMLVPGEGRILQAIDYAGIESRINAWLFGEEWKLQAFRDFDAGKGPDLYTLAYARAFRVSMASVTKQQRQVGKVMELALGYEGGVGAFVTMTETYGVDLDEMAAAAFPALSPEVLQSASWMWNNYAVPKGKTFDLSEKVYLVCESLKQLWRQTNPRIVSGWSLLKEAAVKAVENPGGVYGLPDKKILFKKVNEWLYLRLPSGRRLAYYQPALSGEALTYMGVDTTTRRWMRTSSYGGKWCLAGNVEVLTDSGWKPIRACSAEDRLWDGVAWVYSGGLVAQGVRSVVQWEGVKLTPDHEVLTDEGWKTAAVAQSQGHNGQTVRLPDRSPLFSQSEWQNVLGPQVRLRRDHRSRRSRADQKARSESKVLRVQNGGDDRSASSDARHVGTSGVRGVAQYAGQMLLTVASCLAQLRRTWNSGLSALDEVREFLGRHGRLLQTGIDLGENEQQSRVQSPELSVGDERGTEQQSAGEHAGKNALGFNERVSSVKKNGGQEKHDIREDEARMAGGEFVETYDLVNAGPRKRFTVRGVDGQVVVVHNCENAAQAIARDILVSGMLALEEGGYPIVATVHDEAVSEIDEGFGSVEEAGRLMCRGVDWAEGLPLAVEGWRSKRFRK